MDPIASVERYLASLPEGSRAALESLRRTIRAAAPDATEAISYQMPAFRQNGRSLVAYAAFKEHCSLFPMSTKVLDALGDAVAPYRKGKGTLHFEPSGPLPATLVTRIVEARLAEIAERARL